MNDQTGCCSVSETAFIQHLKKFTTEIQFLTAHLLSFAVERGVKIIRYDVPQNQFNIS